MFKYLLSKGAPNSNCKTREVGRDTGLLSHNFYVLLALSSQLSAFSKLCIMNTLSIFCHVVVSETYLGWPAYPLPRLVQNV